MKENLAKSSFWSTFWTLTDTIATKGVAFVVGIVLARLLTPSDFGIIGMMLVFTSLCDVVIESGTSNALIRKVNRNDCDCSTALYLNLGVAIVAYTLLYLFSPFIAHFYNEKIICKLIKVAGLNVLISALCIVPNALLIAEFKTKMQAKVNIIANLLSGITALALAYWGFGIWALIVQTIVSNVLKCCGYWISIKWKPTICISKDSLSYLWNYSSKSFLIGMIGTFFANIHSLLIGKFFTPVDLGYFSRANQFAQLPNSIINSTFQRISVATFAVLQDDKEHLLNVYRKYIHVISCVSFALFFFLALISKPLVLVLLTDRWLSCVPMISIIAIGLAFSPLGIINLCLLQTINKLDYSLKLEIKKKMLFILILILTIPLGLMPMIIGATLYNILATMMNMSCSKKFIGYIYLDQFKDIFAYLLVTIISSVITILAGMLMEDTWTVLILQSIIFWTLYWGSIYLFKLSALKYFFEIKNKIR